jgi:dephospho-CoA kinase
VRAALTGGIASGKSSLAGFLVDRGAGLADFDVLSREALAVDTPGYREAVKLFGKKALNKEDSTLDRAYLRKLVFKKPKLKKALENIVHPKAWEMMLGALSAAKDEKLFVIDVPLLFEARLNSLFFPTILVFADAETQIRRVLARDPGTTENEARAIIENQWPAAEKLRLADMVVRNDGSGDLARLKEEAGKLHEKLLSPDFPKNLLPQGPNRAPDPNRLN